MKTSTNTLLTGLAAAAIAGAGFAGLNAWFISSPVFAAHVLEEGEQYASLTVTMDSIIKNLAAAEKQRAAESIQNTEDSILFLKSLENPPPPQDIERLENRRARQIRFLDGMDDDNN